MTIEPMTLVGLILITYVIGFVIGFIKGERYDKE